MPALAVLGFGTALGLLGSASVTSVPGVSRTGRGRPRFHRPRALLDQRLALQRLAHRDRPYRYFSIRADHVNDGPIRPLLDRVQRDRQAVRLGRENQPHIDEGAGPELTFAIGKLGFELHGPRAGIGLVVDDEEFALVELSLAVL